MAKKRTYASDEFEGFSRRRLSELAGLLVCALAVFIAVAMLSYHPADPGWNVASHQPVYNLAGKTGAFVADLLRQVMGYAPILASLTLLAWGWRFFTARKLTHFGLRLAALLSALALAAMALQGIAGLGEPTPATGAAGGAIGRLVALELWKTPLQLVVPALAAVLVWPILYYAAALRREEWLAVWRGVIRIITGIMWLLQSLRPARLRGLTFDDYRDDENDEPKEVWWKRLLARFKKDEMDEVVPRRRGPMLELDDDDEYDYDEEDEGEEEEEEQRPRKKRKKPAQTSMSLRTGHFELPSTDMLSLPKKQKKSKTDEEALAQNARLLETVLQDFGVKGEITKVRPGPVVTLYELEPAAGTRSSRVVGLSDDIARSMSSISARIAPIPGRNAIGIELPNVTRETVFLRDLFEDPEFEQSEMKLPLALGRDIGGAPIIADLAKMPHLLVAGTTGSGKSVAINTMIASLLYKYTPEECKFIMIDPKMLELSIYDDIPHLLTPVVTEPHKAVVALKWIVKEMENRYRLMSTQSVRNVEGYNKRITEAKRHGERLTRNVQTGFDPNSGQAIYEEQELDMNPLPFIVVVVDEMADLMMTAGKEIESSIQRLAQMARAAGIHIIMATQRPSVDVITGVIKANFPTRISFQVTSRIDSRTILGEQGAEQLLGQGDMLFMAGGGRISRVHGPFVSDAEVEAIVTHLKAQGEPVYIEDVTRDEEEELALVGEDEDDDDRELYEQAVAIVLKDQKASTSYIQRCLKIGYNRAARLIDKMERENIVGPANHVGKREVLRR